MISKWNGRYTDESFIFIDNLYYTHEKSANAKTACISMSHNAKTVLKFIF